MGYHYLNNKLEDTIKAYIQSIADPDANVYVYGEVCGYAESLEEPFVAIRAANSTPAFPEVQQGENVGNRIFPVEIAIRTHAADVTESDSSTTVIKKSRDQHADLCGQILDCFYRTDIVEQLNSVAVSVGNILIDQVDVPTSDTGIEGRSYVTVYKFEVLCHPTT